MSKKKLNIPLSEFINLNEKNMNFIKEVGFEKKIESRRERL